MFWINMIFFIKEFIYILVKKIVWFFNDGNGGYLFVVNIFEIFLVMVIYLLSVL